MVGERIAPPGQVVQLQRLDIGSLWLVTSAYVSHYLNWLGSEDAIARFRVALSFTNAVFSVPLVDADAWASHVDALGVPFAASNLMQFPSNPESSFVIDHERLWFMICEGQAHSFGLTTETFAQLFTAAVVGAQKSLNV